MIISASRRTDIPSYYSDWFFHRLEEGNVLVRNPVNQKQVGKVSLSPGVVDGIVFWTKNPVPMLNRLKDPVLEPYSYYFQFTLTPYGKDAEPGLPSKKSVLIPAFRKLASLLGRERVIWRYDPVFFSDTYTLEYHSRCFRFLASELEGCMETCTVSFLDYYSNTFTATRPLRIHPSSAGQQLELLERFSETAAAHGFRLNTCAEALDSEFLGIPHGCCIDKSLLERIGGCRLSVGRDTGQRPECGCASSIDIGAYNSCRNGCLYCYANHSPAALRRNYQSHDPRSPLLYGSVQPGDIIRERKAVSFREDQLTIFDLSGK